MLSQNKKQECFMKLYFTVSKKALETNYHVAKLIAHQKKLHTVGKTLIRPACLKIAWNQKILGPKEVKKVRKVPLSVNTIKRQLNNMSNDMLETLKKKVKTSPKFCNQIDKTTDISKKAQQLSVVHFVDGDSIAEEYLFCKELLQGVHELRQRTFWPLPKIQKIKTSIATHDLIG